jgi:hypothetical protein
MHRLRAQISPSSLLLRENWEETVLVKLQSAHALVDGVMLREVICTGLPVYENRPRWRLALSSLTGFYAGGR